MIYVNEVANPKTKKNKRFFLSVVVLILVCMSAVVVNRYQSDEIQISKASFIGSSDEAESFSNDITDYEDIVKDGKRIVREHHADAEIPFITVYEYPVIDSVSGAAVPAPQNIGGTNYYRVISTDSTEDTGDEVCAIALNTSCTGYVDESVTGFNVCKAFHPTAAEVTDTNGDLSVTYCNGAPQAAPCSGLSNTCLACPTCTNGVACNEAIGGLYREMYVTCTASAATGVDLCSEPLDDDDGSGDGIVDLTASETTYDNGSIIIDGCTVAIDGDHTFTNVTVRRNGVLTQSATGTGTINKTNLTVTGHTEIAIGSSIYGDGRGAAGNYHIDPAVSTTNAQVGAKNSHGGAGDSDPTEVYGDYTNPIYPGSGGTKADGAGGGVFELNLNTLELEGEITVDGAVIGFCGGTSGTGGSIKATITGEMTGDGTFSANAGRCTNTASNGSGGRIAIYYTTAGGINAEAPEDEYTLQAVNISSLPSEGAPGTIYLEDMNLVPGTYATGQGRLIITEGGFTHNSPVGVPIPATVDLYELEIDAATVTMTPTDTALLNINNLLDIRNGGVLTYTDMVSLGPIKRLIIDATDATVQVDATSFIDGRGKGAIFNEQIDPDSSTTNAVAGFNRSHGGLGDSLEGVDKVYGDFWDPQFPGSGGQSSIFKGGGYIRILADTFTHNGIIRADGSHGGCAGPPGSGGSVKIVTTGVLSGTGTIQANAGNCTNTVSGSAAGRVAFFYTTAGSINATPPDQLFSLQARNENIQANLGDASPGTIYIEDANAIPGTYASGEGILIIDNGSTDVGHTDGVPLLGTVNLYELRINHANVTAETLNIANTLTVTDGARLKPQSMVTLGPIRRLDINAENATVTVDATSYIDAQGRGTVGTDKIDPGTSTTNAIDGSNTSHGGVGGSDPSEAYGDFFNPIYPGSGGTFSGSRAGGVIDLHANTLDLSGTITASANVHGGCGGTAASGGSVKLTIDSTYTGAGSITADSGNCTNSSSAASGGRIAVFYTTAGSINTTPPDQQFTISSYALDSQGSAGTIYIEDANAVTLGTYLANQGRLIIKDVTSTTAITGVPLLGTTNIYDLVLDRATSTAETIIATNSISLTNSALLRHEGMSSLGSIKRLIINSPNADLTIDGTSSITLNGLGAIANQQIDPSSSTTNAVSGANNAHGGIVGTGYSAAYGDFRNPLYPGSGGTTFGSPFGGGYASITVAGFAFDGTITANGNNAGCGGTTGSGGAVKVVASGELTGSGSISATGSTCTNSSGIGAGGRIAFFYDSDPAGAVANASPETLYTLDTTYNGANTPGPGTIYIEDDNATNGDPDNQGDLIVDGEGVTVHSTPLFSDETPTSLTLTNLSVINNADLILTSPCTGSLTVTGTIDLSNGGSITDNTAGACSTSFASLSVNNSIDNAVNGQAYSDQLISNGGYAPKTYQCLDGLGGSVIACDAAAGLPTGLTMSGAGVVSGTPTVSGAFNFIVRVTDSDPGVAQTAENTVSFTVGNLPNTPVLVSPTNGGESGSLNPVLKATYSDADAGDTGTIDFRVSSSSSGDCLTGTNIVSSGSSAETTSNNETASFTVSPTLVEAQTYYWCARSNDGAFFDNSGSYTTMGSFIATSPAGSNQRFQAQQPTNNQDTTNNDAGGGDQQANDEVVDPPTEPVQNPGSPFSSILLVTASDNTQLQKPANINSLMNVRVLIENTDVNSYENLFFSLNIPEFITYQTGSLIVNGQVQTDSVDGDDGQVTTTNISAIDNLIEPEDVNTVTFQLGFNETRLRSYVREQLGISTQGLTTSEVLSAAISNPIIQLQGTISATDVESTNTNAVELEPNLAPIEAEEMPQVTPPVDTPDQGGDSDFDNPTTDNSDNESPTPPPTTTNQTNPTNNQGGQNGQQNSGNALNQNNQGDSIPLPSIPDVNDVVDFTITGNVNAEGEQVEVNGTTSEPNATVIVVINNSITLTVQSDANGNWKTFVNASELFATGESNGSFQIDTYAVTNDGRRSNNISQNIFIERQDSGRVVVESIVESESSSSAITQVVKALSTQIIEVFQQNEPEIQTTLAVTAPVVIASSAPLWGYLPYTPTLAYHFITWILGLIGRKKREEGHLYGTVYDSITKEVVPLAIVRIYSNEENKLLATVVTDKAGRYESLLQPGSYKLQVVKPTYSFPSTVVTTSIDGDYQNVSQGLIEINEQSLSLPDLPVDPANKPKQWSTANMIKKAWLTLQNAGNHVAVPILLVGSLAGALMLVNNPTNLLSWVLTLLYVFNLILQLNFRTHPVKQWGIVYDLASGAAIPLATLQLIDPEFGKVVKSRLSDYQGRFAFLPEPGQYVIKASKEGYTQPEVVEQSGDLNPIQGKVEIKKEGGVIDGDVALKAL